MMADDVDAIVKGALEHLLSHAEEDADNNTISPDMIRALLAEPVDQCNETNDESLSPTALCHQFRGLPKRPLYKLISRRLQLIQTYDERSNGDEALSCFMPASHFGLTEISALSELIPPPPSTPMNILDCTRWLHNAGDDGLYAIMGCRRTIGTIESPSYLLPPTIPQLLDASRKLYKPHTKSALTVAARALAKHAHRGTDRFFGVLKGSEAQKNEHADRVIHRLIDECRIHHLDKRRAFELIAHHDGTSGIIHCH